MNILTSIRRNSRWSKLRLSDSLAWVIVWNLVFVMMRRSSVKVNCRTRCEIVTSLHIVVLTIIWDRLAYRIHGFTILIPSLRVVVSFLRSHSSHGSFIPVSSYRWIEVISTSVLVWSSIIARRITLSITSYILLTIDCLVVLLIFLNSSESVRYRSWSSLEITSWSSIVCSALWKTTRRCLIWLLNLRSWTLKYELFSYALQNTPCLSLFPHSLSIVHLFFLLASVFRSCVASFLSIHIKRLFI